MCFSSVASFSMSGPLVAGGAYYLYKAGKLDQRDLPMAFIPVAVAATNRLIYIIMKDKCNLNCKTSGRLFKLGVQ